MNEEGSVENMASIRLTVEERKAMRKFVESVERLTELGATSVGLIADYVGEYGVDSDGELVDTAVVEALRAIVDVVGRRR